MAAASTSPTNQSKPKEKGAGPSILVFSDL